MRHWFVRACSRPRVRRWVPEVVSLASCELHVSVSEVVHCALWVLDWGYPLSDCSGWRNTTPQWPHTSTPNAAQAERSWDPFPCEKKQPQLEQEGAARLCARCCSALVAQGRGKVSAFGFLLICPAGKHMHADCGQSCGHPSPPTLSGLQ